MSNQGQTLQSIYKDELHFNTVRAGVLAVNNPNDKRLLAEIARSCNVSRGGLSNLAKQHRDGNFPDSYEEARTQGRGMSGGNAEYRTFAEDNVDVEDIGRGMKSQLFRNYKAHFSDENADSRRDGMKTVRANIKRLCREREERAALAAEAANYDSSNDSSDDEGGFH